VVPTAALVLEPIFEADFDEAKHGYRPKRSALDAVRTVSRAIARGTPRSWTPMCRNTEHPMRVPSISSVTPSADALTADRRTLQQVQPSPKAVAAVKAAIRHRLRPGNQALWAEAVCALDRTVRDGSRPSLTGRHRHQSAVG
jgi:hypothetical protein